MPDARGIDKGTVAAPQQRIRQLYPGGKTASQGYAASVRRPRIFSGGRQTPVYPAMMPDSLAGPCPEIVADQPIHQERRVVQSAQSNPLSALAGIVGDIGAGRPGVAHIVY